MTKTTEPAAPRGTSRPYTRTSRAHALTRNAPRARQFDNGLPHPCSSCAYFVATSEINGECRRFPPTATDSGHGYRHPIVPRPHWCGLWTLAETAATSETIDTIGG